VNYELLAALLAPLVVALGAVYIARRLEYHAAHAVGGVGQIGEALVALEHELHRANVLLEGSQGTNGVGTRLAEIEAKVQSAQLVVADAVEKVTSLSSRIQTRVARSRSERNLLDDGDEGPDTPLDPALQARALRALGVAVPPGGTDNGEPSGGRRPKAGASGWDRVRRTAAGSRREA
jgi:hypothetical protein